MVYNINYSNACKDDFLVFLYKDLAITEKRYLPKLNNAMIMIVAEFLLVAMLKFHFCVPAAQ